MSDGNKRILGDVWINQENLDRQREFFRDIIESYQDKYGGEFDASTLQGLHAVDFATAEQGVLAEHAIQEPLLLGKTTITNIDNTQYIYSDAIKIDKDTEDSDSTSYELSNIDWFVEDNNLTDALVRIYKKVIEIAGNKLDTNTYNTFLTDKFNPIYEQYTESNVSFVDQTGTRQGLNADLVNGIRPILITEAEYNRMKTEGTQQEQAHINDWRNFFIFVDSLPDTYNQPWEYSLTDPYSFRINDGYLQVKNNISTTWTNIAPLEDFLSGANFDGVIKTYLEESDNYELNLASLLYSLTQIPTTTINENWSNYPFLSSSLHDDFIYTLKIDDNDSYYISNTTDANNFKNTNIDMRQILIDNQVLDSNGNKRINSMNSKISTAESNIRGINNDITSLRSRISSIERANSSQASTLTNYAKRINDLEIKTKADSNYGPVAFTQGSGSWNYAGSYLMTRNGFFIAQISAVLQVDNATSPLSLVSFNIAPAMDVKCPCKINVAGQEIIGTVEFNRSDKDSQGYYMGRVYSERRLYPIGTAIYSTIMYPIE